VLGGHRLLSRFLSGVARRSLLLLSAYLSILPNVWHACVINLHQTVQVAPADFIPPNISSQPVQLCPEKPSVFTSRRSMHSHEKVPLFR